MAIYMPFEIAPSDDTICALRQKPAAFGNILHHCALAVMSKDP